MARWFFFVCIFALVFMVTASIVYMLKTEDKATTPEGYLDPTKSDIADPHYELNGVSNK